MKENHSGLANREFLQLLGTESVRQGQFGLCSSIKRFGFDQFVVLVVVGLFSPSLKVVKKPFENKLGQKILEKWRMLTWNSWQTRTRWLAKKQYVGTANTL